MLREVGFEISIGGQSSQHTTTHTVHVKDQAPLDSVAVENYAIGMANALAGALLYNTFIVGARVRDVQNDQGVPVPKGGESKRVDLAINGRRWVPDEGDPTVESLPEFVAVEIRRNPALGRPGIAKLRGALSMNDVEAIGGRDFRFTVVGGNDPAAQIRAAYTAMVAAAPGAALYLEGKNAGPPRLIRTVTVAGVVDNDPTRLRKSDLQEEKEGYARQIDALVKRATEVNENGGNIELLSASRQQILDEIKAEIRTILIAAGVKLGAFLLKRIPEWLQ